MLQRTHLPRKTLRFFLIVLLSLQSSAQSEDDQIKRLLGRLIEITDGSSGVGAEPQKISATLAKLDSAKVIEATLPLLNHKKKGVPYLASYVILDSKEGLRPEHLAQLTKGFENGGGWLPSAIASLETDEAAKFLAKEFRKYPQTQGQIDWSLTTMGAKAVPHLLSGIEDPGQKFSEDYLEGIGSIFNEMKPESSATAIPQLLRVIESKALPNLRRQEALILFGHLGKPTAHYFPRLQKFVDQDPAIFGDALTTAKIVSGTSFAAEALADRVDQGAGEYTLREIALLGTEARLVGPRVLTWLEHDDWDIRVMAARTIGAIGFVEGRAHLEKQLTSGKDWRLSYTAAISLGALGSKDSLPHLQKASTQHWFPIVREAASAAKIQIEKQVPQEENPLNQAARLSSFSFVNREHLSMNPSKIPSLGTSKKTALRTQSFFVFLSKRPELAKEFLKLRNTSGADFLKRGLISILPMKSGELFGASAGEWTGGLQYLPENGSLKHLMQANIFGMEEWQDTILIASGMYHMGINEGSLYQFTTKENNPQLTLWFVLPGEPKHMWIDRREQLIVECIGGTLVFTDKDHFTYYSDPGNTDTDQVDDAPGCPFLPGE